MKSIRIGRMLIILIKNSKALQGLRCLEDLGFIYTVGSFSFCASNLTEESYQYYLAKGK